jgi:hypothetical protein
MAVLAMAGFIHKNKLNGYEEYEYKIYRKSGDDSNAIIGVQRFSGERTFDAV